MPNLFASPAMAAGYARSRPPVHAKVVELIRAACGGRRFDRALDVGCGSGLSTRALAEVAGMRVGLEPAVSMLAHAGAVAPGALFAAGSAEALPFAAGTFDLIAAAGSLNYTRVDRFFAEASRALAGHGIVAVYDFAPGRVSGDTWFAEFVRRYPFPAGDGRELSPDILAAECAPLRAATASGFQIALDMSADEYARYMLTETNVADAVARGTPLDEIDAWVRGSTRGLFGEGSREVLFDGYYALFDNAKTGI